MHMFILNWWNLRYSIWNIFEDVLLMSTDETWFSTSIQRLYILCLNQSVDFDFGSMTRSWNAVNSESATSSFMNDVNLFINSNFNFKRYKNWSLNIDEWVIVSEQFLMLSDEE